MTDNFTANTCSLPLYRGPGYLHGFSDTLTMKKYHATFKVRVGRNGGLIASDMDQGIFTDARTWDELLANIHEAVECHFDVPSFNEVDIQIEQNNQNS